MQRRGAVARGSPLEIWNDKEQQHPVTAVVDSWILAGPDEDPLFLSLKYENIIKGKREAINLINPGLDRAGDRTFV